MQYKKEDLILYVLYVFPTSLWNKPLFSIVTDLMYRKQIGMTNIYYIVWANSVYFHMWCCVFPL